MKKSDITTGEYLQSFTGHQGVARSLVVSGKWLFSGGGDNTVKQWDISTGACIATFDNSLCAGAKITGVRGLTAAQIASLEALGATAAPAAD